jgi:hypothetical protein
MINLRLFTSEASYIGDMWLDNIVTDFDHVERLINHRVKEYYNKTRNRRTVNYAARSWMIYNIELQGPHQILTILI